MRQTTKIIATGLAEREKVIGTKRATTLGSLKLIIRQIRQIRGFTVKHPLRKANSSDASKIDDNESILRKYGQDISQLFCATTAMNTDSSLNRNKDFNEIAIKDNHRYYLMKTPKSQKSYLIITYGSMILKPNDNFRSLNYLDEESDNEAIVEPSVRGFVGAL